MRCVRPEELKLSLLMGSPMAKIKRLYFCVLSYQEGRVHLGVPIESSLNSGHKGEADHISRCP